MSPDFILTAVIVCLLPGIGVVYALAVAAGGGFRAGIWRVLGCTLAAALHLGFALAGLAAILHLSAELFQVVTWIGIAALGGVFVATTFFVFTGYAAGASLLRERVLARPAVLAPVRRAVAASFAGLGLRTALERA